RSPRVSQIRWAKSKGDQLADRMALDGRTVAAAAQDLDVATAQLGRLENCLTATAAGRANGCIRPTGDSDARHLVQAELVLCGRQRALLGAEAEAVAGIFNIGAG